MKRLTLIMLLGALLASCGGRAPAAACDDIVELQPRMDFSGDEASYTKVFLAGTIDMGRSIDWQAACTERFRTLGGRYLIFNPRRAGGMSSDSAEFEYQVRWELEHLEKADIIIMNILGSSQSPITLLEMGAYLRSGKLHVACEPDFYRYGNVRITCDRYGVPLYSSLNELWAGLFGGN